MTRSRVTFEVTPPRVGRYVYEIAVPVAHGEAVTDEQHAQLRRPRHPRQDPRAPGRRPAVVGRPRAARRCSKSNPNVDLISFFILRTQDDISLVPNDEMSLIPFPTRELFEQQLPSFDLIVLQNFEYLPYGIGDYLENIRSYVEGGGGLAMLGGARRSRRAATTARRSRRRCRSSCYGPFDSGADARHAEVPAAAHRGRHSCIR